MKTANTRTLAASALLVVVIAHAAGAQAPLSKQATPLAGAPLVETRRTAIDALAFDRPLDRETIRKWMHISSRCTLAEFELFLAPLAPDEEKLLAKIARMPAPIVNRLPTDDLRGVLASGGLLSLREEEKRKGQVAHTTPAVENDLYGAFDCVFASVGPPHGSPRYGDAIIRLKDSVRENGWATPFSGMHFLFAIRHKDARKMQQLLAEGKSLSSKPTDPLSLGFDDRLHFSHYVVTEDHWNRALAYQAILVLRGADDSPAGRRVRARFQSLLTENDPLRFWESFIPAREEDLSTEEAAARAPFGYLEGKFAEKLSIDDFTAIEVPRQRLAEVLAWPEARNYRALIRAKAESAP
ncbi:MAG: hypothetical protein RIC55_27085 [Pirellulaceae bacterium]